MLGLADCWMLRSAAATPSLTVCGVGCCRGRRSRSPTDAQAPSPQRAGGAAGAVGPGVGAARCSTVPAPAPRPTCGRGRVDGGACAALHADAVVAVAGDRVDVAESPRRCSSMVSRIAVERGEDRRGRRRGTPRRRRRALLDLFGGRRRPCSRRRSTVLRRSTGRPCGRPASRPARPRGFEFVVQPEQGQRDAGHVEAGDEFAHLGLDGDDARRPAAVGRFGGRRRTALRT